MNVHRYIIHSKVEMTKRPLVNGQIKSDTAIIQTLHSAIERSRHGQTLKTLS